MTTDLTREFAWILAYLDQPDQTPRSALRRQNPEPVDQLIANWPEARPAHETRFRTLRFTMTDKAKA